jgi:hypothetical protein
MVISVLPDNQIKADSAYTIIRMRMLNLNLVCSTDIDREKSRHFSPRSRVVCEDCQEQEVSQQNISKYQTVMKGRENILNMPCNSVTYYTSTTNYVSISYVSVLYYISSQIGSGTTYNREVLNEIRVLNSLLDKVFLRRDKS